MLIILAPECNLVQYFLWQNPEPVLRSCELWNFNITVYPFCSLWFDQEKKSLKSLFEA